MSLILGLDVATTTGFAWYDTGAASMSSIRTGLIKAQGENSEEKAASLALQLRDLFYVTVDGERKLFKPDFVAIERPLPNIMQFEKIEEDLVDGEVGSPTVNPHQMLLPTYIGAVVAILAAYRIPFETIPPQTWRKAYFGSGFKPPKKMRSGKLVNDWKTPAVERARALKIAVKSADAAEAIGIAFAGSGCQKFKMMQLKAVA